VSEAKLERGVEEELAVSGGEVCRRRICPYN
jgi:hypothetical protein